MITLTPQPALTSYTPQGIGPPSQAIDRVSKLTNDLREAVFYRRQGVKALDDIVAALGKEQIDNTDKIKELLDVVLKETRNPPLNVDYKEHIAKISERRRALYDALKNKPPEYDTKTNFELIWEIKKIFNREGFPVSVSLPVNSRQAFDICVGYADLSALSNVQCEFIKVYRNSAGSLFKYDMLGEEIRKPQLLIDEVAQMCFIYGIPDQFGHNIYHPEHRGSPTWIKAQIARKSMPDEKEVPS